MHGLLGEFLLGSTSLTAQGVLLGIWAAVWPYLLMLIGFSVIISVHELGHFLVAKWADVRVEKFAVGFGREVVGFTWGETRYSFNILPFGGYVKMLGQEDFDDKTNELLSSDDPRSFLNKPVSHRMAIVSAGVIANVLFACVAFMVVFMIGMERPGTRIGFVEPDSPADRAGLLPGDNIVSVNGKRVLEFTDVRMAVPLAAPHEPINFVVERNNQRVGPIGVKPDYRRPESTRDMRRQAVGISQGFTREIRWLGPGIDSSRPDSPRVGDVLVEADGQPITDENASAMRNMLAYAKEVYVERPDLANPDVPPQRVRVNIPPQLALYPSDTGDKATINLLGLTPLVRFGAIDPDGRAHLAGLDVGDTVLTWDDTRYPNSAAITAAVRDNPERDIYFKMRTANGDVREGFVRPKQNRYGAATIQASCKPVPDDDPAAERARSRFAKVRPFGRASQAGIESGDLILSIAGRERPTAGKIKRLVRENGKKGVPILLEKKDGRLLRTVVHPQPPGAIDAGFSLVADDWLQVGDIVPEIAGRTSPAAVAGISSGVRITAVDDHPVSTWRELIARFRDNAGGAVSLSFVDERGDADTVSFPVPHSLRTILGVGPEARIVSVAGRKTVRIETGGKREEVHVGYQEGLRTLLTELAGENDVPIEFRRTPLSDVETMYIAVAPDMIDPWVGRIVLAPNIEVAPETKLLRGENALEAVQIGVQKTYYFILQVYQTMQRMFFSRSVGFENLSGPLGIVSIGGKIARAGLVEFLFFMAILSANLAVINFLPLPIVDGGLMIFLIIEKIKGSPVSLRVQVATQMIGLFLIVGVFMFVTYNDWQRMFG